MTDQEKYEVAQIKQHCRSIMSFRDADTDDRNIEFVAAQMARVRIIESKGKGK